MATPAPKPASIPQAGRRPRCGPLRGASLALVFVGACGSEPDVDVDDAEDQPPVVGACPSAEASDPFLDCVDSFIPGDASFGHDLLPQVILGPPRGAGELGGTDVLALGCGGQITVYFAGEGIVDGPGDDFIVFENPFALGDGATFVEPARVFVSDDGERWREYPCSLDEAPPLGCAGVGLVHATDEGDASIDPRDPERAGGDAFDLAEVGLTHARWVRLVDVGEDYYGHGLWCAGGAGGFDLDAIVALHSQDA